MKKPEPLICPPMVNRLRGMNGLQRAAESFRYTILSFEHWMSPHGHLREWVRRNALIGTFLFIPAVLVMPAVGLILWQVDGWVMLLTNIVTILITHPVQTLLLLIVLKMFVASIRR